MHARRKVFNSSRREKNNETIHNNIFLATKAYISILKKQNSSTHTKWKESMYYMIVNLHWEGDIGRQFVFHRLDSGTLNSIFYYYYMGKQGAFFSMFLIKLVGVTSIRGSVGGGVYFI